MPPTKTEVIDLTQENDVDSYIDLTQESNADSERESHSKTTENERNTVLICRPSKRRQAVILTKCINVMNFEKFQPFGH